MSQTAAIPSETNLGPLRRWWTYQAERFPLVVNGLVILAFSLAAVVFSAFVRQAPQLPSLEAVLGSFTSAFLIFALMRVLDEFKDFEDDTLLHPSRPVQRGLVSLGELRLVGAASVLLQFGLAAWLAPGTLPFLLLVWAYLALMAKEFFVREWLRTRPMTYMWTHMPILAFIGLYLTAWEWRPAGAAPPPGLAWFLGLSVSNGIVLEMARKLRAPADEQPGVQTYTSALGPRPAILTWLTALMITAALTVGAAYQVHFARLICGLLALPFLACVIAATRFLRAPTSRHGKLIQPLSGLWTFALYLSLGLIPLLWVLL